MNSIWATRWAFVIASSWNGVWLFTSCSTDKAKIQPISSKRRAWSPRSARSRSRECTAVASQGELRAPVQERSSLAPA